MCESTRGEGKRIGQKGKCQRAALLVKWKTGRVSDGLGSRGAQGLGTVVASIGYLSCHKLIHLPRGLTAEFQRGLLVKRKAGKSGRGRESGMRKNIMVI